jgi:hypothetical protein
MLRLWLWLITDGPDLVGSGSCSTGYYANGVCNIK